MTEAERLDRIEALVAIADLVHEYARMVRRDEPERVSELFAPGGSFEMRDGHPDKPEIAVRERLESPEALRAYLLPGKGKPHPIPLIRNLMVAVEGDTASANAMMDGPIPGTTHRVFGEYHDSFVRHEGRWLFSARIFTIYNVTAA